VGYQPIWDEMAVQAPSFEAALHHRRCRPSTCPPTTTTDPAPADEFAHLDATTKLSRNVFSKGIFFRRFDPLASSSKILDPAIVGDEHYASRRKSFESCSGTRTFRTSCDPRYRRAVREDKQLVHEPVASSAFLSQKHDAAEQFTGQPGSTVPGQETIEAFDRCPRANSTTCPSRRSSDRGLDDLAKSRELRCEARGRGKSDSKNERVRSRDD